MNDVPTVLGIDQNAEDLKTLELILQDLGVQFVQSQSTRDTFDILQRKECALIILETEVQDDGGYETASLLRDNIKTRHIPILFVTGLNIERERLFLGLQEGAVDYLEKPVNPAILKRKVQTFLDLYSQKKSLERKAADLQLANERISRQQQVLLEREIMFQTAFEQSFQFMAILDAEGRIIELNRLAKRLCGDYAGELKGERLWRVCWIGQDEENIRLQQVIQRAAQGEGTQDEATFIDRTGVERILARCICPVKDNHGQVVYIAVQGHDITSRVHAEQEKSNLETLLQQAQKMEALGTLAGGIAHDFNNILSAVIGYAELCDKSCDDSGAQKHYIAQILTAGKKAKDLVHQILSFSRKKEVERVIVDPAAIVLESIKLLRASIPSTIEIDYRIDHKTGAIKADPIQYHQVVINLCTNAFQAMERTGGTLRLALTRKYLDSVEAAGFFGATVGDYCLLRVADDGTGIDQLHLDKIFDPYFTTKERGKGTGMGLSIVHGIVKSHGGFIGVDSNNGQGTSFEVYIPLVEETFEAEEELPPNLKGGKEHILLVDDDETLLELGRNMLELMGYRVTTEASSIQALRIFEDRPEMFDLVISDQTMPAIKGTELFQKMSEIKSGVLFILCTGFSPSVIPDGADHSGIASLIQKPFGIEELSTIVRLTLDRSCLQ